jgi:HAD superfamily hydrolase (TIGR01509 family)
MDGTLVNSEKFKGIALSKACRCFGGNADPTAYKAVMGEKWSAVTDHFFKTAQISPEFNEFNTEFRRIYQKILNDNIRLNTNAKTLLIKLIAKGKKTAVVSSASTWMVDKILSRLNLQEFFNIVITQEHVKKHKPDPEAYLLALEQLDLHSSEVLVFEDSNAGLIAASKAGCDAVAFKHEFNINHDLSLAIKVISDFNEI